MQRGDQAEAAAIRANLLQVVAAFFTAPPTAAFLEALRDNPLAPVHAHPEVPLENLVQEFHDLFQVPTGAYVFPYESCYRGRSKDGKPGPLMGPATSQVQDLYRQAGFEVAAEAAELPDHAGVEFAMLQRFAQLEAEAWRAGDETAAQLWTNYQTALLGRHLVQWIPTLCGTIQQHSREPYFQEFATWICRLLGLLAERGSVDALIEALSASTSPSGPDRSARTIPEQKRQ